MYKAAFDTSYNAKNYNFADPTFVTNSAFIFYKQEKIPRPSAFVMLADTFTVRVGTGVDYMKPNWQFTPTATSAAIYVHRLHNNFADCGFSDGHVAGLDAQGLRATSTEIHYSSDMRYNITNVP
jgi:hypothetical protein